MINRKRDWFHLLVADDWIRLAVLAPLSSRPPADIPTHSVGATLRSLRAAIPSWQEVLHAHGSHHSTATLARALDRLFGPSLEPLRPLIAPHGESEPWQKLWEYCARFMSAINLQGNGDKTNHRPVIRFSDAGPRVYAGRALGAEQPLHSLWGTQIKLSNTDALIISNAGSASTPSLFSTSNPHSHYLQLGPLSYCSQACLDCANLYPSSHPHDGGGLEDGIPTGFNVHGTLKRPTPDGDMLHFARSVPGLNFKHPPSCDFCSNASPLPPPDPYLMDNNPTPNPPPPRGEEEK